MYDQEPDDETAREICALIPAAGRSRRMGRPKLLLPLGDRRVIDWLLDALRTADLYDVFLLARMDDADLVEAVLDRVTMTVQPAADPPDMRTSVKYLLDEARDKLWPRPDDGWMLVPADHPVLKPELLATLCKAWQTCEADVLVPEYEGRRGHPTIFRWSLAERVAAIPPDQGLNWLLRQPDVNVQTMPTNDPLVLQDMDTPNDYDTVRRLLGFPQGPSDT
ncbi:molybdopterin-guanine dinucleotide biosynthesis protein MobA [Maioricimonas rarisocia]|uniref:Molybdopterin-guanine dinucleotide biosynthesis protein MobA n=1 Tax=Maioricimonas rarisocia TaxID=2528026 RepID=A0A517Z8B2_9PLAN|nr:nucleotidyltransferase family protein [Maioricimonas rarisocia]QDU38716.1 molybdopterin-guanine dinucleotide biosynthesis protein MobA [Maioricimonas rarisocia]